MQDALRMAEHGGVMLVHDLSEGLRTLIGVGLLSFGARFGLFTGLLHDLQHEVPSRRRELCQKAPVRALF
jgi:hypothetical protein